MAGEFRRSTCDTAKLLGMKTKLPQLWEQQQGYWKVVMEKIPLGKMAHHYWSEFKDEKVVTFLETSAGQHRPYWEGLKKCWMPLPASVMLFPDFRYFYFNDFSSFQTDLFIN